MKTIKKAPYDNLAVITLGCILLMIVLSIPLYYAERSFVEGSRAFHAAHFEESVMPETK